MKVLLVGDYLSLAQESMTRFAGMLHAGLADAGHDVRLVRPPVWVGRLHAGPMGLRPPMTEIGGDAAIYVDTDDEEGSARAIAEALADRERWRAAGFQNASRFSAAAMIAAYVESYQRLVAQA